MKTLFIDTETTGMWRFKSGMLDPLQPNLIQVAALLHDSDMKEVSALSTLVYPKNDWVMTRGAQEIHGITMEYAKEHGVSLTNVCYVLNDMFEAADVVVAHNMSFDRNILRRAFALSGFAENPFKRAENRCTMLAATPILKLPKKGGHKGHKWPKLEECMKYMFDEEHEGAHDALVDVKACARVYYKLIEDNEGIFDE